MTDPIVVILASVAGAAMGKTTELVFGSYLTDDGDSIDPDGEVAKHIAAQGMDLITYAGENASSSEQIPDALEGYELKADEDGVSKTLKFE